jgi:hypothetical protein
MLVPFLSCVIAALPCSLLFFLRMRSIEEKIQSELDDDLGRRCSTLKLLSAQLTHPAHLGIQPYNPSPFYNGNYVTLPGHLTPGPDALFHLG